MPFRLSRFCGYATLVVLVFAPAARAQAGDSAPPLNLPQAAQQAPGFPVTGRVLCADTQRPARFAQVTLIAASQDASGGFGPGRQLSARTDLDGGFLLPNVPPGDYYLAGALSGYVNTAPLIRTALNDPSTTSTLAGIPLLHVSAGGASASLSLQRGAVLAGTVTWDDGSPAGGVNVTATPATNSSTPIAANLRGGFGGGFGPGFGGGGSNSDQTDDRGRFRISGIAPGAYLVRANVQAPAPQRPDERGQVRTLNFAVYAPDKLRRTDATPITLAAGEERPDLTIVLGLAALHSVSGTVSSMTAAVHSGSVYLTDQTDSSLNRTGAIAADGSFTVPYVPAGTYTLRVNASSQLPGTGRRGDNPASAASTRFQPLQESVTVADGDLSGLSLNVTAASASQ